MQINVGIGLRIKYYIWKEGKTANVAATAAAREMACFIWGMMTNHIPEKTYIGERNKFL